MPTSKNRSRFRTLQVSRAAVALALVIAGCPLSAASHPACVFISEADPQSKLWLEDDGTLVTERLGERTLYPTSTGGGTGIMTRIYYPEDPTLEPISVLFYDLSEIAKPDAPQSLAAAFGNLYFLVCEK